jgi:murein DD-endopeptidase MepM/ murein hydrolase activator NlpD
MPLLNECDKGYNGFKQNEHAASGRETLGILADQLRLRRAGEAFGPQSGMNLKPTEREALAPPPRRSRSWSLQRLALIALAAFGLATWLGAASSGYLTQRAQAHRLQAAYADLGQRAMRKVTALEAQIATLQKSDGLHTEAIDALSEIKDDMAARLAAGERRLRDLRAERDRALHDVQQLEQEIEARDLRLEGAMYDGASLADELAATQARLMQVSDQRDASQRTEAGLRWRLASIQTQLEHMGARQAFAQSWLEGWVLGNLETLEELVAGTGVDVDMLVARAAGSEVGQGGPLEAMAEESPEELSPADSVTEHILRLTALQKLTSSLPLASPLDQFQITSSYGKRQDPFTKGWAFHGGLDLGAPRGTTVLTTAPGTVLVAGRSGPYGNMVEIDHGMGVITRYGHLKSVAVEAGDHVGFRQNIGVIGSTGRSTSLHLHYEIRVDGEPYDPSRFLDAGRYLVAIFDLGEQAPEALGDKS